MDVYEALNETRLTGFHYKILLTASLLYCLTALDVMLIGSVLPAIAAEWKLDKVTIGLLLSSGFVGMFFGAIIFGRLADVIGRKPTLAIVVVVESVFTALCGLAYDVNSMALLRFLAGIGLGGALPQPGVYVSEYVPAKYRGTFLGFIESSWVWGALLSLAFPIFLIPSFGWRQTFLVALLPLILLPLIVLLPESIRYLIERGRVEDVKKILKSIGITRDISIEVAPRRKFTVKDLLSKKYFKRTILLWILWAALVYTYYGIFIWLPAIYYSQFKLSTVKSIWWTLLITLFQVPGYYTATFLLDRVGRKKVLTVFLVVAGIASLMLGLKIDLNWIFLWSSVISFFNLGAWAGLYTYTPELYPTEIRGTGFGVAASIGRLAGILAPTMTGILYATTGLSGAFILLALVHLVAGFSVLVLGIETRGKTLEELTE